MKTFMRHASIVSTIALMTAGTAGLASAQSDTYSDRNNCIEGQANCPPREMRKPDEEDQGYSKKRRLQQDEGQIRSDESDRPRTMRQARSEWRFDSDRQERRRHRDKRFRFEFGGYWYPQPYWLGYGLRANYRIGCDVGRDIVSDHGFNRVRTVECKGSTYTYLGRRDRHTFRVLLSSRSGRVVDIDRI
jgi:hypothetical protein